MNSSKKESVIFICTHNSARSQMAEAFLKAIYGDRFEAYSAGTEPTGVNPFAVEAMMEAGIDISHHRSKSVDEFLNKEFDYVITVCDKASESCPQFPGGRIRIHKAFDDPSKFKGTREECLREFRRVRDEIRKWIEEFFRKG